MLQRELPRPCRRAASLHGKTELMAQQCVRVHCAADREVFQMKSREEIPTLFLKSDIVNTPKSPGQISTNL